MGNSVSRIEILVFFGSTNKASECHFFNFLLFLGGVLYHFQTSFVALSEYPDLLSRILKACPIPLPIVNQTLTDSLVGFEINLLHLKYEFV